MEQIMAEKFIEDNKECLDLLIQKINEADTVFLDNEEDMKSNRKAIEIVDSWMAEIFAISKGTLRIEKETDFIKRYSD